MSRRGREEKTTHVLPRTGHVEEQDGDTTDQRPRGQGEGWEEGWGGVEIGG